MSDAAPQQPPSAGRAAVAFIFFTLMLDVLAMGVIIPVMPKLIEGFMGAGHEADAVRIGGLIGLVWAVMQFLTTPLQGALSDRFGRRPVLLVSMTGLGLDYVLMASTISHGEPLAAESGASGTSCSARSEKPLRASWADIAPSDQCVSWTTTSDAASPMCAAKGLPSSR